MTFKSKINKILPYTSGPVKRKTLPPTEAYNLWSESYDQETDNLMLYYDNIILASLLSKTEIVGKTIFDYGCGTGRNWPLMQKFNPAKITGGDVSPEMLLKLKAKYERAETFLLNESNSFEGVTWKCDIIVSTLVIAHIKNLQKLFSDWNRILNDRGVIIITDFHPVILARGGERTFRHGDEIIKIENFVHPIDEIEKLLGEYGFSTKQIIEKKVEEDVKYFYERHNALQVYEKFKGDPFIYGLLLSR